MLSVILYKNIEEIGLLSHVRNEENLYICPGPLIADGVRALLGSNANVVTIAKWVSEVLKVKNQKRIMKSELLLRLSSVWRHYFPQSEEDIFLRAFEIFTDLRSFTLDQNLLQEVLEELDPSLQKSVLIFWLYFETEKLVDEQLAYKIVGEESSSVPLCFVGFKHMNAIQIDMIKRLAETIHVTVLFPYDVYVETLAADWIRWLLPESTSNVAQNTSKVKVILFQRNKLNITLNEYRKINNKNIDIAIPSAEVDFIHYQEVINPDVFFKTDLDLFDTEINKVFIDLKKQNYQIAELLLWIEIEKNKSIKEGSYRALKVLTMIKESLEIFQDITSTLDSFYVSILRQVISLNSPRNYFLSLQVSSASRVLGLEEYRFQNTSKPVAVIASSEYRNLSPKNRPYNEEILKSLMALGPLKRGGLDFLFAKETLLKLLTNNSAVLFLEDGLIDEDLAWREVLKNLELEFLEVDVEFRLKKIGDAVKNITQIKRPQVMPMSASSLQSYLDCPRKYYFSYIEKIKTRPKRRLCLDPDEKGILEHKIIEAYLLQNDDLDFNKHTQHCKQVLQSYLSKGEIKLSKQLFEETYFELLEYTKNGIEILLDYKNNIPGSLLKFEVEFNDNNLNLKGFIDCILVKDNEIYIFDFKRSSSSIGSPKELFDFEKIQLWVYRWALLQNYKVVWWGYINLSDGSITGIKESESSLPEVFDDFLLNLVTQYRSEVEFSPKPRTDKVCGFCELQLFCPKEKIT